MAYQRRFGRGGFDLNTALQNPDFQRALLAQIGQENTAPKASFLDRLFRAADVMSWTDDVMEAKRRGTGLGGFLKGFVGDVVRTPLDVLRPGITKEEIQKDMGQGTQLARSMGLKGPLAGVLGFGMDVFTPDLAIGGVTKTGVKGLSGIGKEFVEKGVKEIGEDVTKESVEKLASYVGKEFGENAAKSATAKALFGEGTSGVLKDIVTQFGGDATKEFAQPGLKVLGQTVAEGKVPGYIGRFIDNPAFAPFEIGSGLAKKTRVGRAAGEGLSQAAEPLREMFSFGRPFEKAGVPSDIFQKLRLAKKAGQTIGTQEANQAIGPVLQKGMLEGKPVADIIETAGGLYDTTAPQFIKSLPDDVITKGAKKKLLKEIPKNMMLEDFMKVSPGVLGKYNLLDSAATKIAQKTETEKMVNEFLQKTFQGDDLTAMDSLVNNFKNIVVKKDFDLEALTRDLEGIKTVLNQSTNLAPEEKALWGATIDYMAQGAEMHNIFKDLGMTDVGMSYFPRAYEEADLAKLSKKRKYITRAEAKAAGKQLMDDPSTVFEGFQRGTAFRAQAKLEHATYQDMIARVNEGLLGDAAKVINKGEDIPEGMVKSTVPMLGKANVYVKEEVDDVLNNMNKILYGVPQERNKVLSAIEKLTSTWRGMQTGMAYKVPGTRQEIPLFPGYHLRNKTTNMFDMVVKGNLGVKDLVLSQGYGYNMVTYAQKVLDPGVSADELAEVGSKMVGDKTVKQMYDEAVRMGIASGGTSIDEIRSILAGGNPLGKLDEITRKMGLSITEDADTFKSLQNALSINTEGARETAIRRVLADYSFGKSIENSDKFGLYATLRNKGMSASEARKKVADVLYDYSELTLFEKEKLRPLFAFYTWNRKNIESYWRMANENPGRLKSTLRSMQGVRDAELFGEPMTEEEKAGMPDWLQNSFFLNVGGDGDRRNFITGFGTSLDSLGQTFGATPQETAMNLLSMGNPAITIPLQATLDRNFFKDKPISEDTTGYNYANSPLGSMLDLREEVYVDRNGDLQTTYKVNPWRKFWFENIIGRAFTTAGTAGEALAGERPVGMTGVNLLTGLKLQSRDMKWDAEQKAREEVATLDKQLVQYGIASPKSGVYLSKGVYKNYPQLEDYLQDNFGYTKEEASQSDVLKRSTEREKDRLYIEQMMGGQ